MPEPVVRLAFGGAPRLPVAAEVAEPVLEMDPVVEAPVEPEPPSLFELVQFLAGRCDGARTWDGQGFNKWDAPLGHALAELPASAWKKRHEWSAFKWATKYRRQLTEAGYDVSLVKAPEPIKYDPPELLLDVMEDEGDFRLVYRHLPQMEFNAIRYETMQLPGRWMDRDDEGAFWRFSPSGSNAAALKEFVDRRTEFVVTQAARDLFEKLIGREEKLVAMSRAIKPTDEFVPVDPRLWPHQNAGEEYVVAATAERIAAFTAESAAHVDPSGFHGCMIADQMGTGKTATALFAAFRAGAFDREATKSGLIVICPASVKHNWRREAIHWLDAPNCPCKAPVGWDEEARPWHIDFSHVPGLKVRILEGTGAQPIDGDIVIVNYDVLRWSRDPSQIGEVNDLMWILPMREWFACEIDECHYLKNEKALRSEAVKHFLGEQNIPLLLMLSGSPILNRTDEFVSQLDLLGLLRHFGNRHNFERAYCGKYGRRKELNQKLREIPGYLARLKDHHAFTPDSMLVPLDRIPEYHLSREVRQSGDIDAIRNALGANGYEFVEGAMKLPPKVRQIDLMEMTNRKEYDFAMAQFREWLRESLRDVDGGMEKFIRMMRAEVLVRIEKLRQLCVRGKMQAMIAWIEEFLTEYPDEKLVVFVQHDMTEDAMMSKFASYNPLIVTGGQAAHVRDREWQTFQNDPSRRLLVAKLKAGGVGINLTAASHCVMAELDWNPGNQDQGEDRLHRGGQTKSVTIHYHFAAHTIDQTISLLIDSKRSEVTAATHGGEAEENAMIGQMLEAILDA